jgi:hypothetical protein
VKAEGTLSVTVTTLFGVFPSITKSKRPSSLVIVSDNAKHSGNRYLTYEQHIQANSVV